MLKYIKRELLFIPLCLALGCEPAAPRSYTPTPDGTLETITHEGHKYVVYDGFESGGVCHSGACWCRTVTAEAGGE